MKNQKAIIFTVILTAISFSYSFSQSGEFQKLELKEKILNQKSPLLSDNQISENVSGKIQAGSKEKSPYLGSLFSGIIPGTGELYAQRYLKAAIFFAIEAGLWTTYGVFESKGDNQTDEFQSFADENWDVYKYAQWLKEQNFSGADGIDLNADKETLRRQVNVVEASNFSHQLPEYGSQQYYELIGKYQNFVPGWEDADLMAVNRNNYLKYSTAMYSDYSYDRQQANDYYNTANTTLIFIILNHVASAADAAFSVSAFNKDLKVKTSLNFENKYTYYRQKKMVPVAHISVGF